LLEQTPGSGKIISESGMKRITPNRVALFIGVMTAVAAVVYLPRYEWEQRKAQAVLQRQQAAERAALQHRQAAEKEMAARNAAQDAAAERAKYTARYLNPGFTRNPGQKAVAIAAQFQTGEPDRPIADALARHLESENLVLFTSFFKPAFYADGLFNNILAGATESIDRLELTNRADALLLAQEQVQYSTNGTELDNVITAHARLEVAFLPFGVMRREQTWTYLANGAGFNPNEARSNADERLLKQIAGDTNMVLLSLPSQNQESYP
jgi:hypothetical protein